MSDKCTPKSKRGRGVILTTKGWQKLQQAMLLAESEHNWGLRFTREQLNERTGLSLQTISRILKRQEAVDKLSIEYFLRAFSLELSQGDFAPPISHQEEVANKAQDWDEAVDVSVFFGREQELAQLQQWILEDNCRLVTVLGIGGIGKTSLAVKLGLQIQTEFEVVIWRSLQNAPSLEDLLTSILSFLLPIQGKDTAIPASLDKKLTSLFKCLKQQRCLLILDNAETILDSGCQVGAYQTGYDVYGQMLKAIGNVPHQSCLLLTSREKLREIALLEGERLPVRSLQLNGLLPSEGRELFEYKGNFTGTEAEWNRLVKHYGGNPLVLKVVATATQEFLNGSIATVLEYIECETALFEDIRNLLENQFNRLSLLEQEVIQWLAINREPVTLEQLNEKVATITTKRSLLDAINSLMRRSMIVQSHIGFSLEPLIMDYVTGYLAELHQSELTQNSKLKTESLFTGIKGESQRLSKVGLRNMSILDLPFKCKRLPNNERQKV
ncbi:MAG: NACHT domain-containing protein [Cyanomargarita calcarea GSE-NOS-MK-12-04C]|jgi:transcriptional regulator with XRE-family HTH domain|uniref:NACHT domain-containing protein n=1 Tax=Cyanomargarita calcarea GSE-NOS-MK-12-04C TaxID=2839659 RepID=A0A951USK4_9CYAN|nr:NACHT domain-containing protein [Cyanomargarita calcarea GSE-NOS-MK-12-04C]